ncbi:MAG: hypothetical protein KJO51_05270 [Gramella sp.]|nr:hypothetical protein [Christiangramia sp.]
MNENFKENLLISENLIQVVSSDKFQEFIKNKYASINKAKDSNNGNGIIFMEGGALFGFFNQNGVLFFASNDNPGVLKIFPNGTASLRLNSKDFFAARFSFVDGVPSITNACYEKTWGHLSVNFLGTLEVEETDFGTFYNVVEPLVSAYHFKASNVRLSDETATFDEENQTEICNGDATEEKILNFTRIIANGEMVVNDIDFK